MTPQTEGEATLAAVTDDIVTVMGRGVTFVAVDGVDGAGKTELNHSIPQWLGEFPSPSNGARTVGYGRPSRSPSRVVRAHNNVAVSAGVGWRRRTDRPVATTAPGNPHG